MKKLILMIMLINIVVVSQSLYDAEIVLDDLYWHNPEHEWGCHMHGELYLNGILQQPSQDYYYSWQWQIDGQWVERPTSGYGQYTHYSDGLGEYLFRLKITGPGFSVTSNTKLIGLSGSSQTVNVYAYKENESSAAYDVKFYIGQLTIGVRNKENLLSFILLKMIIM